MLELDKTDASLMIGLSRITNHLHREISSLCNKYDLTQTQFAILEVLYSKGDLLVGEIQRLILSTPGNVPYVINNLIKKEYVNKISVKEDKRCSKISLAPKGRDKILEILPYHNELLTKNFGVLCIEDKEELRNLLRKFREGLKERKYYDY